jgi:hypothetical protein
MNRIIFHLAFPVYDLEATRRFYVEGIGCGEGRASKAALTLELAGHQIIAHLMRRTLEPQQGIYPRHFCLVFTSEKDWEALFQRAKEKGLRFYREPSRRFVGTRAEHRSLFLEDPAGNLLEFKYYTYESAIFGETDFQQVGEG